MRRVSGERPSRAERRHAELRSGVGFTVRDRSRNRRYEAPSAGRSKLELDDSGGQILLRRPPHAQAFTLRGERRERIDDPLSVRNVRFCEQDECHVHGLLFLLRRHRATRGNGRKSQEHWES